MFGKLVQTPLGYVTILVVVTLIFNGIIYISLQLTILEDRAQTIEYRQQTNQTSMIRSTQLEQIQNQLNDYNQTTSMNRLVENISAGVNGLTEVTQELSNSTDTLTKTLNMGVNRQIPMFEKLNEINGRLNGTLPSPP